MAPPPGIRENEHANNQINNVSTFKTVGRGFGQRQAILSGVDVDVPGINVGLLLSWPTRESNWSQQGDNAHLLSDIDIYSLLTLLSCNYVAILGGYYLNGRILYRL